VHLAIALPLDSDYFRGVVRGVAAYARRRRSWRLSMGTAADVPGADAALVDVSDPAHANALARGRRPVLNMGSAGLASRLPEVGNDDLAIGALGAAHLLEIGAQSYGFVGLARSPMSASREEGFTQAVRAAKKHVRAARPRTREELAQFVASLPKPCAILAANDSVAIGVTDVCGAAGWIVPRDVAVLGADDDDLVCELSRPALSSIVTSTDAIGYRAAELIDAWLSRLAPPRQTLLAPLRVHARSSTRAMMSPVVEKALALLRDRAGRHTSIDDLARAARVSPSTLRRQFVRALGHGPLREAHLVTVGAAKALLAEPGSSVKEVANELGVSPTRLAKICRSVEGAPPTALRARDKRAHSSAGSERSEIVTRS
jgi:LacI family transcriptional regulator